MLDMETMSTRSNAAIASIGATKFEVGKGITDKFYRTVDVKDCKSLGLNISKDTIQWWSEQNPAALAMLTKNTAPLGIVLSEFTEWFGPKSIPTWGCGSDFDNVIMDNAYYALGRIRPWKFYHNRCYRTIKEIIQIPEAPREGTYHNALDDAIHQTNHLLKILGS
jgi:exodeoxyribonuclease VIII